MRRGCAASHHDKKGSHPMKLDRIVCLAVVSLAAACASNPHRDVRDAEQQAAQERATAQAEQARLDRQHAEEQARAQQQADMTAAQRAELSSEQQQDQANTREEGQKNIAEADEDTSKAKANMESDRKQTEADAKSRFTKAQAKAKEYRTKSEKLKGDKKAKFGAEWNTYAAKKIEVEKRFEEVTRSTDAEWKDGKEKLEKSLSDLEAIVDRLDKDL